MLPLASVLPQLGPLPEQLLAAGLGLASVATTLNIFGADLFNAALLTANWDAAAVAAAAPGAAAFVGILGGLARGVQALVGCGRGAGGLDCAGARCAASEVLPAVQPSCVLAGVAHCLRMRADPARRWPAPQACTSWRTLWWQSSAACSWRRPSSSPPVRSGQAGADGMQRLSRGPCCGALSAKRRLAVAARCLPKPCCPSLLRRLGDKGWLNLRPPPPICRPWAAGQLWRRHSLQVVCAHPGRPGGGGGGRCVGCSFTGEAAG